MRRLAPHARPLITFTMFGLVTAFLAGWLETGKVLAGVVVVGLVAIALGAAFALLARLLALGPPSLDRAQVHAADHHSSTPTQRPADSATEPSPRGQSHRVPREGDGGERS